MDDQVSLTGYPPFVSPHPLAASPHPLRSPQHPPPPSTGAAAPLLLTPAQQLLQQQLRTKHCELERRIAEQQQELARLGQQLNLSIQNTGPFHHQQLMQLPRQQLGPEQQQQQLTIQEIEQQHYLQHPL